VSARFRSPATAVAVALVATNLATFLACRYIAARNSDRTITGIRRLLLQEQNRYYLAAVRQQSQEE
jgi:hypothetical protein